VEPTDNYDGIYQLCGGTFAAFTVRNKGWSYANIYTAEKDEELAAVSIITHEPDLPYDISIYALNEGYKEPRDGELLAHMSGTEHYAGYHTYKLEKPCSVSAGQTFSAVVKTGITPSTTIFFDRNADGSGTSYYMIYDENSMSGWTDSTRVENHGNTFVKVFTKESIAEEVKGDCNGDGDFGIADAVTLQNYLLGRTQTMACWKNADLCEDDCLDGYDMVLMRQMLTETELIS